ncbi:unnamed protein product, partial [Dovyalis caffra]
MNNEAQIMVETSHTDSLGLTDKRTIVDSTRKMSLEKELVVEKAMEKEEIYHRENNNDASSSL